MALHVISHSNTSINFKCDDVTVPHFEHVMSNANYFYVTMPTSGGGVLQPVTHKNSNTDPHHKKTTKTLVSKQLGKRLYNPY